MYATLCFGITMTMFSLKACQLSLNIIRIVNIINQDSSCPATNNLIFSLGSYARIALQRAGKQICHQHVTLVSESIQVNPMYLTYTATNSHM